MIKNVKWIYVFLGLICLISFSFIGKSFVSNGLSIGDKAPPFLLVNDGDTLTIDRYKGKLLLLNFWATYDAESRMRNIYFNDSLTSDNINMVSICFDEYKSIFNETLNIDNIKNINSYVETKGESSEIFEKYKLSRGFSNYLIDKNGVILAKNIAASDLCKYVK